MNEVFPNVIIAGQAFTFQMEATNNPTTWGEDGMPAGLVLHIGTGVVSGTIAAPGVYAFQLFATNSAGTSAPMFVYLEVSPAPPAGSTAGGPSLVPVILVSPAYPYGSATDTGCIVLAAAVAGTAINNQFYATNEPTVWRANELPDGMALDDGTGILSGAIAIAGNYIFEIIASNGAGSSVPVPVALSITAAAAAAATAPATGPQGVPWIASDLSLTDLQFDLRLRGVTSNYATGGVLTFMQSDTCKLAVVLLTPAQVNDATTLWFVAKQVEDSQPVLDSGAITGSAALTAVAGGSYYLITLNLSSDLVTQAFDDMSAPTDGTPRVLTLEAQLAVLRNGQTARSVPFTIKIIQRIAQAGAPNDVP